MKTEAQIRRKIARWEGAIKKTEYLLPDEGIRIYHEVCKTVCAVLKDVLGEGTGDSFWCAVCKLSHSELECPQCHNAKEIKL